jgi:hypothetical protein
MIDSSTQCLALATSRHDIPRSLDSEFARRGLPLPDHFEAPDRALWEPGYAAEAQRSLPTAEQTLDEAVARVTPFLDPLLNGTAHGQWAPEQRAWLPAR